MEIRVKINIVDSQGKPFMGTGILRLLERIERHASIAGAAREMSLSYVKALKMVNQLEQSTGCAILVRCRGGNARGGASLTAAGRAWMHEYRVLEQRVKDLAVSEFDGFGERVAVEGDCSDLA